MMHTLTLRIEEDYYEQVMGVLRQFSSQQVKVEEALPDFIVTSEAEARARVERAMACTDVISEAEFKSWSKKLLDNLS
jgi:hypothetical protein